MANNRNKKKINSKQANRISLIISAIYLIYMSIKGAILKPTGDDAAYYWIIACLVGTFFIYGILYFFVFNGNNKRIEENEKRIQSAIRQHLSNTEHRQVYFLYEECDIMNMIVQILQKEECKFYAKLTENNNVHLVVKDKYDEEVYSVEIENLIYFNTNFKFDE